MRFFLYEIFARIVAIYLCVDFSRELRRAFVERKIRYFTGGDFLNWFLYWSNIVANRDTAPVRYWIEIGIRITILVACLFVAIFGWWQPKN